MSYECDNDDHNIGCQCPGVPNSLTVARRKLVEIRAIAANNHIGGMSIPMSKRLIDIIDNPNDELTYDKTQLRRESIIASCHCETVPYRPHKQGENGCTGIPVVAIRWVSDWEVSA